MTQAGREVSTSAHSAGAWARARAWERLRRRDWQVVVVVELGQQRRMRWAVAVVGMAGASGREQQQYRGAMLRQAHDDA